MAGSTLYQRPDLYDLVAPADPAMEQFYLDAVREGGGSVLELACGSGRLVVPLARAGARVVGGDLSPEMLLRAQMAAEAAEVEVELLPLDMRDFDLGGRRFDTIMIAANSLLHLHTQDDFGGFFRSVAQHLSPGGRLVFDAFVPTLALLSLDLEERQLLGRFDHADLGEVTIEETIAYDPITQVSHVEWYWSTADEEDFWRTRLQLRQIFPQEMPLLVAAGGFRPVERFGDFDRSGLTAESGRQVCICALA